MRNESHKTLIGTIRSHLGQWRKREGWSRETLVTQVIEAHEACAGPLTTGIHFDPATRDAFERSKVNADRVFRWLDDESKDNNLLPANFLPSVLAAMPPDVRLHCVNELLRPLGLAARSLEQSANAQIAVQQGLVEMIREDAEAHQAFAALMSDVTDQSLDAALKEINESIETKQRIRSAVESAIVPSDKVRAIK